MELDNDAMYSALNLSQLKESGITKAMFIDLTGVEIMSKKNNFAKLMKSITYIHICTIQDRKKI